MSHRPSFILRSSIVALLLFTWTVAGCGHSTAAQDETIVRIGSNSTISRATLTHWMFVLAPSHRISEPPGYTTCLKHEMTLPSHSQTTTLRERCAAQYEELKKQALDFLIASRWLAAEADSQNVGVSANEVRDRLAERRASYSGGAEEFRESVKSIGRTVSDLETEIRAELAAQKLKRKVLATLPAITRNDISTYYRRHIKHYHLSEKRDFYLVENLRGRAAAQKLREEFTHGRDIGELSLKESLSRTALAHVRGEKRIIELAIFHAKANVITDPILINGYYFLVKVTNITKARLQPLVEVSQTIMATLTKERQRKALTAFIAGWRRKWTTRTNCASGYTVQKCKQYSGNQLVEDPLTFN